MKKKLKNRALSALIIFGAFLEKHNTKLSLIFGILFVISAVGYVIESSYFYAFAFGGLGVVNLLTFAMELKKKHRN